MKTVAKRVTDVFGLQGKLSIFHFLFSLFKITIPPRVLTDIVLGLVFCVVAEFTSILMKIRGLIIEGYITLHLTLAMTKQCFKKDKYKRKQYY